MADQDDGLDPGHQRASVVPHARPDDGDPRLGHRASDGIGLLGSPTGPRRGRRRAGLLRRGSFTDVRSRKTSRTGVPSNPNVARSRFSRYRRYEKCTAGVGRDEPEGRWRHRGLRRVEQLRAVAANRRRRRAVRGRQQHPVERPGRDPFAALAPDIDGRLEHAPDALAGLGAD
jgi:hypothetical protein